MLFIPDKLVAYRMIEQSLTYIKERIGDYQPKTAMILGSGLGGLAEQIREPVILPYQDIPGFPSSTVKGHAGRLIIGYFGDETVMMMQGRVHFYEGHPMDTLTHPVRVMHGLGVEHLIVTCASGGINTSLKTGDIMILKDHVNLTFYNPFIGRNDLNNDQRFLDTTGIYDTSLIDIARNAAARHNIDLQEGTYFFLTGPSYETPAEVNMIRTLGGDVAGMSTFPEVLEAKSLGLKILGMTYVSNMGAGISDAPLDHDDIMETMKLIKKDLVRLVTSIVNSINNHA